MSATSRDGLLAECGALIGLSTIAVILRFCGRKHQNQSLGLDDWTALIGCVTFIGQSAIAIELAVLRAYPEYGSGSLTHEQVAARAKPEVPSAIAFDFLSLTTLACAKLSALFLYQRIFSVSKYDRFNAIIKTTVGIIIAWWIAFNVLSCLQCRSHFSALWNGEFKKYCDLNPVWAKGLAISDFVLDLWVLALPVSSSHSHMGPCTSFNTSIARRLQIIGLFLLAFVLGASIARIVIFFTAKAPGGETLFIGVLEAGMTITVVNLPSIWHICTSTIPQQVVISLQSMRSLGSTTDSNVHRLGSQSSHHVEPYNSRTGTQKAGIESHATSRGDSFAH